MQNGRLLVVALAGGVGVSTEAHAGAWTQDPGKRLEISTISIERGDFGDSWGTGLLIEQGFAPGWGGHLKYDERRRTTDAIDQRGALELGVRRAFAVAPQAVLSVQGAWLGAEGLKGPQCSGSGYEFRTAAGLSGLIGKRNAYLNLEAAWRSRGALCEGRLLELAGGLDLSDRWRVLGKAWSDRSDGDASDKIEASLFRDFETFSLGLGYRQEISGEFGERGVVLQVWSRF
jgi:hypothetical protein